ncbi:LTA synthase family protein [Microvirga sp. 2MCAF38]|uniref:LTA synthase family protein n=1 Tax=Microvirga sp. 2MCAF38 TaxID=3232989 RepID=UPI003F9A32DB
MNRFLSYLSVPVFYGIFGLAGINLIEFGALRDLSAGFSFIWTYPIAAGLTFAAVVAACVLFDSILGRRYLGAMITVALFGMVGFMSGEKQKYLMEPLFPWDFLFVDQVIDLLPQLLKNRPLAAAGIGLFGVIGVAAFVWAMRLMRARTNRLPIAYRLIGLALSSLVLAGALYATQREGKVYFSRTFGIKNNPIIQSDSYRKNGFILAFLLNADIAMVEQPSDYSQDHLEEIANAYAPTAPIKHIASDAPDVVIIMSEAFWDPTQFPGVTYDRDPLPFIRSIQKGEIYSPVFAGGTANTEFEALTGFSTAFLPEGSFPYQQYIPRPTPALPWLFRSLGYRTVAVHPYHKWFWSREKVYPRFGFQQFLGLSDMKQPATLGVYTSDEQVTDYILDELDEDAPTFLFAVTMQNHTPFNPKRYGKMQLQPGGNITKDQAGILSSYVQGIEYSDKALQRLTEELAKRRRPTLLIFFGDHAPGLGDLSIYRTTGLMATPGNANLSEERRFRRTPLVAWWSDGKPVPPIGIISPAFVPELVTRTLNIDHPFYTGFLGRVRKDIRVNDRRTLATNASGFLPPEPPAELESLFAEYHALQYDQMIGGNYARNILFCEMPGQTCAYPSSAIAQPKP